jgi:hypothetical protein
LLVQEVKHNFVCTVSRFEQAYMDLGISVSPKVHAMIDHIVPFKNQRVLWMPSSSTAVASSSSPVVGISGDIFSSPMPGLGRWSKQASKAVHHDFQNFWEQGQRVGMAHSDYPQHLLNCVICYSSRHV